LGARAMSATASLVVLSSSSSLAASKSPITVALITSETGLAGPESGDASQGFQLRIAHACRSCLTQCGLDRCALDVDHVVEPAGVPV